MLFNFAAFIPKNLSKTYLNAFFEVKLPKYCNHRKTRNSLFYAGLLAYFPQQFLYFLPDPHVVDAPILSVLFILIVL